MHILITGVSGALGREVLKTFGDNGHKVAALVRSPEPSIQGLAVVIQTGDLSEAGEAARGFQAAKAALGRIDAVVHLVGAFNWVPVADSTPADWRELYATNVETTLNLVHAALPHLQAGSSITCVSAASAQPAKAGMAPYAAAKSAVARIVEALADELRPQQIRVNAIAPAIIDTARNRADMPDADPANWTSPAAIADTIAFLAGPQSRAINGACIPVTNNV